MSGFNRFSCAWTAKLFYTDSMITAVPLPATDPLAVDLRTAIHTGNVAALGRLLDANPGLVHAWIGKPNGASQTLG